MQNNLEWHKIDQWLPADDSRGMGDNKKAEENFLEWWKVCCFNCCAVLTEILEIRLHWGGILWFERLV
jgi:hypothetical protein